MKTLAIDCRMARMSGIGVYLRNLAPLCLELLADVASLFIAESEDYCRALELALAVADAGAVQREAHTVKSMLATFSCESGRRRAFELEQLGASGQLAGAAALVAEVSLMVRALAQVLEKDARGAV